MNAMELAVIAVAAVVGYLLVNAVMSAGKGKGNEKASGAEADRVLGVQADATPEEVRAAYQRLSSRYAPEQLALLDDATRVHAQNEARWLESSYREAMRRRGATP